MTKLELYLASGESVIEEFNSLDELKVALASHLIDMDITEVEIIPDNDESKRYCILSSGLRQEVT